MYMLHWAKTLDNFVDIRDKAKSVDVFAKVLAAVSIGKVTLNLKSIGEAG